MTQVRISHGYDVEPLEFKFETTVTQVIVANHILLPHTMTHCKLHLTTTCTTRGYKSFIQLDS